MNLIYIRTSTALQTPELQLNDIDSLNPPADAEVLKEKESAWKENEKRPVFDNIVSLITSGKVKNLFVWDLDRVYRNRKRLVEFLTLCKNYRTQVYSYNQQWLRSIQTIMPPFNEIVYDLMLQILGWIAEEESIKKSNRVKMAVRKEVNGTFSHKGNKWGRKTLPKQTVARIMQLHEAGKSLRQIASDVMVYDRNNNGKPISKSAVHKTISRYSAVKT